MNRWDARDSIFAPIIAAVPPKTDWAGFHNALYSAEAAIPTAAVKYNVKRSNSFKRVGEIRDRMTTSYSGDSAKPFAVRARLLDRPRDAAEPSGLDAALWEVGLTHLKDGLLTPAVPADFDSAMLQVSTFRLSAQGQAGAPQLALLRHRFAAVVLSASPDAIVFGGQHHWDDQWWNETILESQQ